MATKQFCESDDFPKTKVSCLACPAAPCNKGTASPCSQYIALFFTRDPGKWFPEGFLVHFFSRSMVARRVGLLLLHCASEAPGMLISLTGQSAFPVSFLERQAKTQFRVACVAFVISGVTCRCLLSAFMPGHEHSPVPASITRGFGVRSGPQCLAAANGKQLGEAPRRTGRQVSSLVMCSKRHRR